MKNTHNDIFRLVNLRGAQKDLSIDPEGDPNIPNTNGPVIAIVNDPDRGIRETRDHALNELAEKMAAIEEEVRNSPLAQLTQLLFTERHIPVTVSYGREQVAIKELAQHEAFKRDYANAYNVWLLAKLQQRDPTKYKDIEDQLRVGTWVYTAAQQSDATITPFAESSFKDKPIALPKIIRQKITDEKQSKQTEALKRKLEAAKNAPAVTTLEQEVQAEERKVEMYNNLQHQFQNALTARIDQGNPTDKVVMLTGENKPGLFQRIGSFFFGESATRTEVTKNVPSVPQVDETFVTDLKQNLSQDESALLDDTLSNLGNLPTIEAIMTAFSQGKQKAVKESNKKLSSLLITHFATAYTYNTYDLAEPTQSDPIIENGAVQALGWGDLIVAKETLIDYEAREIAHIENVLPNEKKSREHTRSKTIEDTFETEIIETDESERELETTTRHELQIESEKTIQEDFAVEAGVNTSGRYGLTKVETSLDVDFIVSTEESQKTTTDIAKEIVSKAVERTFKSVRELRRRKIITEVRELNTHGIDNIATDGNTSSAISGIYRWVEKVHEIQLRHYGTRLMVEFNIPEPALSLVDRVGELNIDVKEPLMPACDASSINEGNYLALAKQYNATGIMPPPETYITVGFAWASQPDESTDEDTAEDVLGQSIPIPKEYQPIGGWFNLAAHPSGSGFFLVNLHIDNKAFSNQQVVGQSQYGEVFTIRSASEQHSWPGGVPISMTAHGHFDKTLSLNIVIVCRLLDSALTQWKIKTFEAIWGGYERQLQDYKEAVETARIDQGLLVIPEGTPDMVNRRTEHEELQKWAVTILRRDSIDFDSVISVIPQNDYAKKHNEIDPGGSDRQAPLVRFYEEAFEWRHMSYFFYPYFWGRRDTWNTRQSIRHNDFRFETFLRAGAARVIVPVTPGYEANIFYYLANPDLPEDERIEGLKNEDPSTQTPQSIEESIYDTMWLELLLNKNEELALGSGFLNVTKDSPDVQIVESKWETSERDIGRELYIAGEQYEIGVIFDNDPKRFTLTTNYIGETDPKAPYAMSSVAFGRPWLVNLPTNLVILNENKDDVKLLNDAN